MDQITTALELLHAGFSVIPVGKGKVPARPWKEFTSRLPTEAELRGWYSQPAGIGVVCGSVSANLEVLDFDIHNWDETCQFIQRQFEETHSACVVNGVDSGPLDQVSIIRTPSGGAHVYYRCIEPPSGSLKLARHSGRLNPATGEFDGTPGYFIETRGEGGYVLSPGSADFCHPLGASNYQHVSGPRPHELVPAFTPQLRDIWLMVARWFGCEGLPYESPLDMTTEQPAQERAERPPQHCPSPGDVFNLSASWAQILEPHGFKNVGTEGEATRWKRPGTENPVSATTNHDGSNLFYAFSPNCHPFLEPGRGYSKFAVFAILNFGDASETAFREATKELVAQGYSREFGENIDISAIVDRFKGPTPQPPSKSFPFLTIADYLKQEDQVDYHISGVIAKGQPCLLAGPPKSLKTCLSIDAGYSMASGTPFLGLFDCPEPARVGIMTGEASRGKNQSILKAIIRSKGNDPCSTDSVPLFICHQLPVFSEESQLALMKKTIEELALDVLIIDPAYLCLGSLADHTANVSKMGNMLREIGEIAAETGCTPIINHHTNRKFEAGRSLSLEHLSGAGWAEWSRQWVLVNPRKDFDPETHQHSLWMVTGGSDGHAGKFAVDVRERDSSGAWSWNCEVRSFGEEVASYSESKQQKKEAAQKEKEESFSQNLREALNLRAEEGSTINELKQVFQDQGWAGRTKITTNLMSDFIDSGFVKVEQVTRGNNQTVNAYLSTETWSKQVVA
ncbi:hypothetical protein KOR42_48000 [Thalassoglobus neptunius]|uniref:DNA primase/polymerase bifunctional N-terminal domain-containing protein n=1 Tax=Thalassoglobus neptunius TaxID=1938619 RepID=A0A5C5VTI8_9PLAN|nr:AAA family ATPase [Thalassoglobus neptunius]TWT41447.1 hypothetical protein KOR42_48000 [Thalassoglobus neptunius]